MRLTPAQIGVALISGRQLPGPRGSATLAERIKQGHDQLVKITGKDFAYDLAAWHTYLKESRDGGYTYGRNIILPRVMQEALASKQWCEAVDQILSADKVVPKASGGM